MALTIRQLLEQPKVVVPPGRKKRKNHPAHRAWDLELQPVGAQIEGALVAGIRINVDLPESFTIMLRFHPIAGAPVVLLRVNGDHGPHKNPDGVRFLEGSHIHRPLDDELDLPVGACAWAEGPPFAFLLEPKIVRLVEGWRIFSARATIADSDGIRRIIDKIAGGDEQMELF